VVCTAIAAMDTAFAAKMREALAVRNRTKGLKVNSK
jgi:hypothetical protein